MKTVDVILYNEVDTGARDRTNKPIMTEIATNVSGVLYAPVSADDVTNTLNLEGKRAIYQLAIPKGDTNNWNDAKVYFLGRFWRTIGIPEEGIEANIPLKWNKKVKVECYE